jgi:hypothetical protein
VEGHVGRSFSGTENSTNYFSFTFLDHALGNEKSPVAQNQWAEWALQSPWNFEFSGGSATAKVLKDFRRVSE